MISHQYKCIFVEVPKTGSTSIRAILGKAWRPHLDLVEIRRLMENYWTHFGGRTNRWRSSLYLLTSEEKRRRRGRKQFEEYFKFGFVRNPWDRVVSLYERREAEQFHANMSFEDFVRGIEFSSATCPHSSPHRYQLDWFVDANGRILADFIGRFERLAEDWKLVAERIGAPAELPHERANPDKRPYPEYYNAETRRLIGEKFRVDIERFGYEFGA